MEELIDELDKAQEKRRTAKRRYSTSETDLRQVVVLENKIYETLNKLLEKKAKYDSNLSVRARLQRTQNMVTQELAQAQVATQHYKKYHRELGNELWMAETIVAEAKMAMQEYQDTGVSGPTAVPQSRQEAAWAVSRTLSKDHSQIQFLGWNSIFPTFWTRCGWRSCAVMKSSLRKQFMCPHLVSRYFLHLDTKQLEEERSRWQPSNFAAVDRKFRDLAAELVGDIEGIIEQRKGDDDYLWKQKRREWYPEDIDADAARP